MACAESGEGATDPTANPMDELTKLSNVRMPRNLANLQKQRKLSWLWNIVAAIVWSVRRSLCFLISSEENFQAEVMTKQTFLHLSPKPVCWVGLKAFPSMGQ